MDPADGSFISGPPRVFDDKVVIGFGGGDFGPVRGYVTAYDTATGKQLWRFWTVPGDPAEDSRTRRWRWPRKTWSGRWWERGGGGTVWNAMTYDPEFNRLYIGTGNGGPWNPRLRSPGGGDNLFPARSWRWMPTRASTSGTTRRRPAMPGTTTRRWT